MLLRDTVPADVEVVDVPGCPSLVALRPASLPLTGIVASAEPIVESEIHRLLEKYDEEINSFTAFIKSRMNKYKLVLRERRNEYFLSQPDYEFGLYLPFYNGANTTDAIAEITEYTETIHDWDENIGTAIACIIEKFESEGLTTKTSGENGNVHWAIKTTHGITGEECNLNFTASPEFRTLHEKRYAFLDEFLRIEVCKRDNPKFYAATLKNFYGLDVRRPLEGKKPGSKLMITHPFHPEISYTMPVPSEVPGLEKIFKRLMKEDSEEETKKAISASQQALNDIRECVSINTRIKEDLCSILFEDFDRYKRLYDMTISTPGARSELKGGQKPGERGVITITHPSFSKAIEVNVIRISHPHEKTRMTLMADNTDKNKFQQHQTIYAMPNPLDLDKWERALTEAAAKRQIALNVDIHNVSPHLALQ